MSHRPYPPPASPPALHMTWHMLLFMHWRTPADALRQRIPARLSIDTFDGSAWIAIVPFHMRHVYPSLAPVDVPKLSAFVELNVRTYVTLDGRSGVWFFSLDAESKIAVRVARRLFHLPYMDAEMRCELLPQPNSRSLGEEVNYTSYRTHEGAPAAELAVRYQPCGPTFAAAPGSLEDFLTARYCLYSADPHGNLYRGEIDHAPWPLQPAKCEIACNTMTEQIGVALPNQPPHLLFAHQLDVVAWPLQKC